MEPDSAPSIYLVGFRACGKSTVGRLLAERLKLSFVDLDQLIAEEAGMTIQEMVAENGWDFFREKERQALAALSSRKGLVVACGGGAVLHRDLFDQIKKRALVVWLTAAQQTILQRLADDQATKSQRPSLTGSSVADEVAAVVRERLPLYEAASHLTVPTDGVPPKEIAQQIIKHYRAYQERTG